MGLPPFSVRFITDSSVADIIIHYDLLEKGEKEPQFY